MLWGRWDTSQSSGSFQKCYSVRHVVYFLPSQGREAGIWDFLPASSLPSYRKDIDNYCVLVQTTIFVSLVSRHLVYVGSYQWSERGKTEASPLGKPGKVGKLGIWSNSFLTQGESGNWVSFQLYGPVLSVEVMVGTVLNFPTSFDVSGFTLAQSAEVSELVSAFLTMGICLCIVESVHSTILLMSPCHLFFIKWKKYK